MSNASGSPLADLRVIFDDQTVFRRTQAGRRELLCYSAALSRTEQQLLAIVNGFTPLRVLLDLSGQTDAAQAIQRLLHFNLIETVEARGLGGSRPEENAGP